jgi:hypothetical protein
LFSIRWEYITRDSLGFLHHCVSKLFDETQILYLFECLLKSIYFHKTDCYKSNYILSMIYFPFAVVIITSSFPISWRVIRFAYKCNTTGAFIGAETDNHRKTWVHPGFSGLRVAQSFFFLLKICGSFFVFLGTILLPVLLLFMTLLPVLLLFMTLLPVLLLFMTLLPVLLLFMTFNYPCWCLQTFLT